VVLYVPPDFVSECGCRVATSPFDFVVCVFQEKDSDTITATAWLWFRRRERTKMKSCESAVCGRSKKRANETERARERVDCEGTDPRLCRMCYYYYFRVEVHTLLFGPKNYREITMGIEPTTFCSEDRCSTFEPRDRNRGMQVIAIRMEMEILA
jgi:hypothetical protein